MIPKLYHVLVIALALASPLLAQTAPSPLETLFKRLDRNGDGKLTGDEASPARREAFDLNKDGVVTLEEARLRCSRSIRPSPFPEEAGRVWYFCGFDQTPVSGRGTAAKGDTAWIYKGTRSEAKRP